MFAKNANILCLFFVNFFADFSVFSHSTLQYKRCAHLWNNLPCILVAEVCASFALQCTVSGRYCKHKTDVEAWHGIHLHIKNQLNILVIGNYYVNYQNYQNYQNLMLLTSSDTKQTVMHLLLFTNSAQRELVSICTQSILNCN